MKRMTDAEFNQEYQKRLNAAMERMVENPRVVTVLPLHPSKVGQALASKKRGAASSSAPAPASGSAALLSESERQRVIEDTKARVFEEHRLAKATEPGAISASMKSVLNGDRPPISASFREYPNEMPADIPAGSMVASMRKVLGMKDESASPV